MKVLIACEESQVVSIEGRKLGHEVYSCDILECSGGHPEWHIQGDVIPLLNGNCTFTTMDGVEHRIDGKWDMIIGFPPCTYMSKAGARHMFAGGKLNADRYEKAMKAKGFFIAIYTADCSRIAIENPVPLTVIGLPKPSQSLQPYHFGHPYSKKTLLWLIGLPPLFATCVVDHYTPWVPSNTSKHARGAGGSCGVAKTAKIRSKTFPGIAKAMAEQWMGEGEVR